MRRALAALAMILPLGGLGLAPVPAAGAALTLDDNGRREAIRVGEKSVGNETFDTEWKVKGAGADAVSVLTPFHRLVIAARHATYSGKPLKPTEPDKLLKENRDRLVLLGDREIKPTFVQNERTAQRQDDGRYLARCVYGFPTRDINGRGPATLIVADADGRDVSRFAIDLGKMR